MTLEDLFIDSVPEHIRDYYRSLAARAQTMDFGPLHTDVIVLDTETTGMQFRTSELIEIAAVRLDSGKVVEEFQTFVKPKKSIPLHIQQLTHITPDDVASAPRAVDAVRALGEFVGGLPILAHNSLFDRNFISKSDKHGAVSDIWIDTLSLSRIALPALTSHSLPVLSQSFDIPVATHRAIDDVKALAELWNIMLQGLYDLPAELLYTFAHMHEDIDWQHRPVFAYLSSLKGAPAHQISPRHLRESLLDGFEGDKRSCPDELPVLTPLDTSWTDAIFAPQGSLANQVADYEERPSQQACANVLTKALNQSEHTALEAGTGVGKSLAYMLPAVKFAQENNITVGIATKTNALTNQLLTHEIPLINKLLDTPCTYTNLKGFQQYPCLERVERALTAELQAYTSDPRRGHARDEDIQEQLTALAVILTSSVQVPLFDLDTLGIRWKHVSKDMVSCASHQCLKRACPYAQHACVPLLARRRAQQSDVVVTNHALLLNDIACDSKIFPHIRHWIVDEAHTFEKTAREQWSLSVSYEDIKHLAELFGGMKVGLIHDLMVAVATTDNRSVLTGLLADFDKRFRSLTISFINLESCMEALFTPSAQRQRFDSTTLWINHEVRERNEWNDLVEVAVECSDKLEALVKLARTIETECTKEEKPPYKQLEAFMGTSRTLADVAFVVKKLTEDPDSTYVYAALLERNSTGEMRPRITLTQYYIGKAIADTWLTSMHSVNFVSATLSVGESFEYFAQSVGLREQHDHEVVCKHFDSHFPFDTHMQVALLSDMPDPREPEYLEKLADVLVDIHISMGGSVLTLFTNRFEMERVFDEVEPRLAEAGLKVLCQKTTTSMRELQQQFTAEKSHSLMALKSFWEGFDAPGDTLRCVVIPKLPFSKPSDPLMQERGIREDRAWWNYVLPEAALEVKQAAGRLIRRSDDIGLLICADVRLCTKAYGATFIQSLPSRQVSKVKSGAVSEWIQSSLRAFERLCD